MRCLATGGAGFIGSTLVDRLLSDGHDVDVVDDLSSGKLSNLKSAQTTGRMTFHEVDIRDRSVLDLIERCQPQVVFHLAAQADVRVSVADPVLDASINILGTLNVLEGARSAKTKRIVAAGSGGTLYGEPEGDEIPTKESAPQRPLSPYGVSKKSMIDYMVAYRALHGIEYMVLALANVYGPRQNPHGEAGVVAIFAERLLQNQEVIIFGDGTQTRDFVYVGDVVDAFVRAATMSGDQVINIGTGSETSVNELYRAMAAGSGVSNEPTYALPRPGEVDRSCLSIERATKELGWQPRMVIFDGAAETIASIRSAGENSN